MKPSASRIERMLEKREAKAERSRVRAAIIAVRYLRDSDLKASAVRNR
jgi:hypothetical protein